jgi:hypothetical protein
MQNDGKAVKAPATRVSRLEARREKLLVTIERTQRRFEKADKMAKRALKTLATLERKRRRMDKAITKAKAEAADDLVGHFAMTEPVMSDAQWKETLASVKPLSPELRAEALATADCDDGVPQFLKDAAQERTRKLQSLPDPKTKEKKAERKAVEKEKREAELTGKRRKLPPSGKAALSAINADLQKAPNRK